MYDQSEKRGSREEPLDSSDDDCKVVRVPDMMHTDRNENTKH